VTDGLSRQLRVVVVDDQELFRSGLVTLLERHGISVVGQAGLGAEGIRLAAELHPDVVLMDLNMPGMSGVEATRRLAAAAPHARVLVLSVMGDDGHVMDALLAGASGYLLKDASLEQIIAGVRAAARGESMISPQVAGHLVDHLRDPAQPGPDFDELDLTPRERDVLTLLARGLDNAQIADALFLSEHTVKNYVSSILGKLEVENRTQAAVCAVRAGLA
jgi:DNA-binding NarL/FixJ family response regulator